MHGIYHFRLRVALTLWWGFSCFFFFFFQRFLDVLALAGLDWDQGFVSASLSLCLPAPFAGLRGSI